MIEREGKEEEERKKENKMKKSNSFMWKGWGWYLCHFKWKKKIITKKKGECIERMSGCI